MNKYYNTDNAKTRKLLKAFFTWQGFHLAALFFTSFRINFQFRPTHKLRFNLFDASTINHESLSKRQSEFYPFVTLYEKDTSYNPYDVNPGMQDFNGIFYYYDYSEFLFYTVLGLIVYYLMFKRLTRNTH